MAEDNFFGNFLQRTNPLADVTLSGNGDPISEAIAAIRGGIQSSAIDFQALGRNQDVNAREKVMQEALEQDLSPEDGEKFFGYVSRRLMELGDAEGSLMVDQRRQEVMKTTADVESKKASTRQTEQVTDLLKPEFDLTKLETEEKLRQGREEIELAKKDMVNKYDIARAELRLKELDQELENRKFGHLSSMDIEQLDIARKELQAKKDALGVDQQNANTAAEKLKVERELSLLDAATKLKVSGMALEEARVSAGGSTSKSAVDNADVEKWVNNISSMLKTGVLGDALSSSDIAKDKNLAVVRQVAMSAANLEDTLRRQGVSAEEIQKQVSELLSTLVAGDTKFRNEVLSPAPSTTPNITIKEVR